MRRVAEILGVIVFVAVLSAMPLFAEGAGFMGIVDKDKLVAWLGPGWETNEGLVMEGESQINQMPSAVRKMATLRGRKKRIGENSEPTLRIINRNLSPS